MATRADIPVELLQAPDKEAFLTWAKSLPPDDQTRQQLLSIYQKETGLKFTSEEWTSLRISRPNQKFQKDLDRITDSDSD